MTFLEFKDQHRGGYIVRAATDIIGGFAKAGEPLYGNCDDMIVTDWLYQPLNGIYSIKLTDSLITTL